MLNNDDHWCQGSWRDQDLGRAVSEDTGGLLGIAGYRTVPSSPRNSCQRAPRPRDGLDAATWFFAGAANTLTGGLYARAMKGMGFSGRDLGEGTDLFKWGGYAGQAINMAFSVINPQAVGGVFASGLKAINGASAIGGAISTAEAALHGDLWGAATQAAQSGLSWLRGSSACSWGSSLAGWGQRGMHMLSMGRSVAEAGSKLMEGNWVGAALHAVQAGLDARRIMQACFVAGTKLLTRQGWVRIEGIVAGDEVWSKPEEGRDHPGGWKAVEETFRREGWVSWLTVEGREIGTSAEHPFFAVGKGWVPAGELAEGDLLLNRDGRPLKVEEVRHTGVLSVLYNCRVADWHTYFVGEDGWGFSVWSHNICTFREIVRLEGCPDGARQGG